MVKPVKESQYYSAYPRHRGELTLQKIFARQRSRGSYTAECDLFNTISQRAYDEIKEFDDPQDLMDHIYWHGTSGYISGGLKPGAYLPHVRKGQGGGGYGELYHSISLSKSKKAASSFSGDSTGITIHPVLLRKYATVVDMPEISDSIEMEEKLIDLWQRQVDAVRIGDWNSRFSEQELVVLNPRALLLFRKGSYHAVYQMDVSQLGNPGVEVYEKILTTVKSNPRPTRDSGALQVNYDPRVNEQFGGNMLDFLLKV